MAGDPEAVASRLFGVVLRHLRTEAGLSLRELGKRCHHDYSRLSRMETGEHLGDPALLAEIDRILGAGGLLTVLRNAAELPSDPPGPASHPLWWGWDTPGMVRPSCWRCG